MKRLLLIFFIILFLLPLCFFLLSSVAGIWQYPAVFPQTFNLRGYRFLLKKIFTILPALTLSFSFSIIVVLLSLLISIFPARLFARLHFRGKNFLEALFLIPALLPPITFSIGAHYLFIKLGISDTLVGVILVLTIFCYPYMLRALIAGFHTFKADYEVCAHNLGAGILRRILVLDLPMLLPAVLAGGTVVFLISFSEYFLVFIIGGGRVISFTLYLFPLLNSSDKQLASILCLVFLIIPLLLFLAIDKLILNIYKRRGVI